MTTIIHSTVEPRKHVRVNPIGNQDVVLDVGRPGCPAVSLAAIRIPVAELRAALDADAPAGSDTRTDEEDWKTRAEKAEKELDEAIHRMNDHSTNARSWMQTSEEWQATAEEWERRAHAAEQPRPLTADDITDSHVLSARLKANALGWFRRFDAPNEEWRQVLTAALTEPPRPEGAEDLAVALFQAGAAAGVEMTPEKRAALADHLAAMGYRKDATR